MMSLTSIGAARAWQVVAGLVFAGAAVAQTLPPGEAGGFRVMHSFDYGADRHTGGARPASLMRARDGNFYGVAVNGGAGERGTVFRMKPSGALTTVYAFRGSEHGYGPVSKLVQASDGHLYGITQSGGPRGSNGEWAVGTVFRYELSGELTTLHTFYGTDGALPRGGLVPASDGFLYGTTADGGQHFGGVAFRIGLDGAFQVLHHFGASPTDGKQPMAALIQTRDGRLCGTTYAGGQWDRGTVYCMTLDGLVSVAYAFGAIENDGNGPMSPLFEDDDGSLYGTTDLGGPRRRGTVYRLWPDGRIRVTKLSERPSGGLMKASDGQLYGAVSWGGNEGKGWIYHMTPDGALTTLHTFHGRDGVAPRGELVEGADGRLYGVTEEGGEGSLGVLYRIARPVGVR